MGYGYRSFASHDEALRLIPQLLREEAVRHNHRLLMERCAPTVDYNDKGIWILEFIVKCSNCPCIFKYLAYSNVGGHFTKQHYNHCRGAKKLKSML